jgi:hypothetical protein
MRSIAVPLGWLFAGALALALAGCGGGGGGGSGEIRTISPSDTVLQGTWQRSITYDGTQSAAVSVGASSVPLESDLAAFTTATVALLFVDRFPNKTVSVSGNTVTVTDPGTGQMFTLVVNSFVATNYSGCGACNVGTSVTLTLTVNVTENGVLNSVTISQTRNTVLTIRFTRTA